MKAIIMAGGYATRLWPITRKRSKVFLPIGKQSILNFVYEKVKKFDIPIIISTNEFFKYDFEKWANGKDVELMIEKTTKEEEKLGAIRALAQLCEELDDDILLMAGDNLFTFELDQFLEYYNNVKKPVTALYDVKDIELAKRYGIAEIDGNRIVKFHEKPQNPPSTLAGIGFYILTKESQKILFDYVENNEKLDNLGDFISYLATKTELHGFPYTDGFWHDVGSPDSYIESMKVYMKSYVGQIKKDEAVEIIEPVVLEDDSEIRGSSVIGPYVYIGKGCIIEDSEINNSVLFDEVYMSKSTLIKSIIDHKCSVSNLKLNDTSVGEYSKLNKK